MSYVLPTFNLTFSAWRNATDPRYNAPIASGVPCQLYIYSRYIIDQHESDQGYYVPPVQLRMPVGAFVPLFGDVYLISRNTKMYYKAFWADRMHAGFPNEYIIVQCGQSDDTGSVPRDISKWDPMT